MALNRNTAKARPVGAQKEKVAFQRSDFCWAREPGQPGRKSRSLGQTEQWG